MKNSMRAEILEKGLTGVSDKEIAKDLIVTMLQQNALLRSEYPEARTVADMVSQAYKTILQAVKEN